MATASEVSEHGGGHERDTLPPTGKGKRGKSADIMASLEARLQRVEFAMADNRDKVEDMDQRIDGPEGGNEEFHREMQGILNSLAESWEGTNGCSQRLTPSRDRRHKGGDQGSQGRLFLVQNGGYTRLTEAQQQKTVQQDMKPEQLEKIEKLEGWRKELKLLEDRKAELVTS
ncbi:hypothetical protein Acr_06g0012690 [Actinidia rufa]|uniref:Uncharacterized protein n=1 Tax=Actinidia rufa TaxID=165716 RepID=A0A7J0ETL3_9ERIC|nr:hypothetical protein Acr_06g0012690 [Actinidia rufa]